MNKEIKKGTDEYLAFADNLQENMYHSGLDYIVDMILDLQQRVEQLENIRKEAIEEIKAHYHENTIKIYGIPTVNSYVGNVDNLLNILNKGSNKDENN